MSESESESGRQGGWTRVCRCNVWWVVGEVCPGEEGAGKEKGGSKTKVDGQASMGWEGRSESVCVWRRQQGE